MQGLAGRELGHTLPNEQVIRTSAVTQWQELQAQVKMLACKVQSTASSNAW